MSEVKNYNAVKELAAKHLGKVGGDGYKDTYDPSLLVAIPRYLNREGYELTGEEFTGVDVWNAYEVSAITKKGQPVAGMLKIVCPANTKFHVESKSIKLYLNSLNMTPLGNTAKECIKEIEQTVSKDLTDLLKGNVTCEFFNTSFSPEYGFEGFVHLSQVTDLDDIEFTSYHSDASQLQVVKVEEGKTTLKVHSDLLRSNCRVTNQPDWGDLFIEIKGDQIPTSDSLARYIVSHRQVSHFHEEIVEMVFTHLMQACKPEKLMVCALYTRRGGIDINPIRATHQDMVPAWMTDPSMRLRKTLRQ